MIESAEKIKIILNQEEQPKVYEKENTIHFGMLVEKKENTIYFGMLVEKINAIHFGMPVEK